MSLFLPIAPQGCFTDLVLTGDAGHRKIAVIELKFCPLELFYIEATRPADTFPFFPRNGKSGLRALGKSQRRRPGYLRNRRLHFIE